MSKVSTRPQKSATPVARAVTAVAGPADAQATQPEEWRTAAIGARDKVAELVQEVFDREASRISNSGQARRLLGFVLDGFARVQIDSEKDDIETHAYDAEALLAGAIGILEVEDGLDSDYKALQHAMVILDKLTDTLSGEEVYPVWDAIRNTPKPSASVRNVTAPAGFNAKQLERVLETIAGNTETLKQMLMLLQRNDINDEFARSVCIDAAKDLATAIGAMAADAIGGCVIGDAAYWHFGPNFADAGKAVTA